MLCWHRGPTCLQRLYVGMMFHVCVAAPDSRDVSGLSMAMEPGRVSWGRRVCWGSPLASVVCLAVMCSAPLFCLFPMRLFVTDAGGWLDGVAHGSCEWSHGYRESSAGSGGQCVYNGCTWACFTCVWRPATHAMYRACSLVMKPGRVTWGRRVCSRSRLASVVCSAVVYSALWYHCFRYE
jgi:hypothetical protein